MKVWATLLCVIAVCSGCSTQQAESLSIEGQIMLCGEGMEGVCVQMQHPEYGTVKTYTDSLGVYRFDQAWVGQYSIMPYIEHCEIVPVNRMVDVQDNTVVHDFIVRPLWEKVYGSDYHDITMDMAKTMRCGFVYTGKTDFTGSYGAFLMRVDALGQQLWYKEYSQNLYMSANSVVALTDGSFVITGCKADSTNGGNIWIAKFDGNGNSMWEKIYGGNLWDEGQSIVRIENGSDTGFIIAATTESAGSGRSDVYIMKIDDGGNIAGSLFDTLFGGQYNDGVTRIIACKDDGYIFTGYVEYETLVRADSRITKINSMRQHVWSKEYNIDMYDYATDVLELTNGDVVVCGIAYETLNRERIWIACLTGDGNTEVWKKELSIGQSCGVYGMTLDAAGNIVCTGYTIPDDGGNSTLLLVALTQKGELLWMQAYGSNEGKGYNGKKVVCAGDDGLAVAGTTIESGTGADVYCLKVNDKGELW
ncbi:MAG: hypothetical protein QHH74_14875 [Spirochaetota bacterium]|nr:hypothetical protein [Spirochaetota bacterium]